MTTPAQLLELLRGTKIFDGISWRVYNDSGVELTHGPVHWGGVHGMLLTQIALAVSRYQSETEIVGGYAKAHVNYKASRAAEDEAARNYVDRLNAQHQRQLRIQQDDAQAVEFIMALLQSEILHG